MFLKSLKMETKIHVAVMAIIEIFLLAALYYPTSAVNIEQAYESPCFPIPYTVPVDPKMIMPGTTLYYNLGSKIDLYKTVQDVLGRDLKDITEQEIYYESCLTFHPTPKGIFEIHGFKNKIVEYDIRVLMGSLQVFQFFPLKQNLKHQGISFSTLTDNKTFVVNPFCGNDNQMGFAVISTKKVLPEKTMKQIKEHLLSIGFKPEFMTGLRYDTCGEKKEKKQEL